MRVINGYIDEALPSINLAAFSARWPNFSPAELACKHCRHVRLSERFMDRLQRARSQAGFPFNVTSGYRCPAHNVNVSRTGLNGPHTTGHAVDIRCYHAQAYELVGVAMAQGFTGIGISQAGEHTRRFIHLDDLPATPKGPRPTIWEY
jgi:zinc D-Ala-D-Ala carboxypeptidase